MSVLLVLASVLAVGAGAPWWCTRPARRLPAVSREPVVGAGRAADDVGPVDVVVVLGLLDAAIASGAGLPRALAAVGRAMGGPDGAALVRASAALVMGSGWPAAWAGAPARLAPVAQALASTWATGAAPGPALRAGAEQLVRERRAQVREAAGRLGVRLVLPLGLCFLPAFVLLGLVPVMVSVGAQLAR
ncbi:type II secretion system F family protein [Cellulomonas sp. ATA003]|uniref:type II secretion system F family protein n=1 Tax=Cellulomonas sp. ATA003 TaxID=3073064 RepID=UPI002873A4AD|nr:type II secretion system F family protein [Cellulomonas sp. ATA003]WNB87596.1 type II secretion system F family protein [Cellulomonas sp. ATA003]